MHFDKSFNLSLTCLTDNFVAFNKKFIDRTRNEFRNQTHSIEEIKFDLFGLD